MSRELMINGKVLRLIKGDITELDTEAIVNAANGHLAHGGGVAGAISRKGGPTIQQESDEWVRTHGPVPTGGAAFTSAGALKAKYVIHAVGPVMGSGDEDNKLRSAVNAALDRAEELGVRSIAFPAISTGIFGYPVERCARILTDVAKKRLEKSTIDEIVICLWDQNSFDAFLKALEN